MPLILGSNAPTGGYEVDNSLRFDDGSSDNLTRILSSPTSANIGTVSHWIKRGGLGSMGTFVAWDDGGVSTNRAYLNLFNDDIYFYDQSNSMVLQTNRVVRDTSAWYHIVVAWDTTQATASDRVKIYVNGVQETSFSTETYPAQNSTLEFNTSGRTFGVGSLAISSAAAQFFDGYMSEVVFVDGQALDPTSFGEFDAASGIWKPKNVSGLTFGTNGFYLEFKDSSALGDDTSGNGNDFTVNNLTSIDQTTDTPTNNFATGNPLLNRPTYGWGTLSEGNLKHSSAGLSNSWGGFMSNIIPSAGKWYAEVYCQGGNSGIIAVANAGTFNVDHFLPQNPQNETGFWAIYYNSAGYNIQNGAITLDANVTNFMSNAIVGIALDCDNQELTMYINGSVVSTVNGLDISNTTSTDAFAFMSLTANGTAAVFNWNFGNPPFTISSGNSDADGYGNFEYAVPSGYYALNTKNLSEYG